MPGEREDKHQMFTRRKLLKKNLFFFLLWKRSNVRMENDTDSNENFLPAHKEETTTTS